MKVLKGLKNIPHIQELGGFWFYIVFNDVVFMLDKIVHVWIMVQKKPRMLVPAIEQPQFLIDFWLPVLNDGASRLPKIWPWVDPDVKTNSSHNVDALN